MKTIQFEGQTHEFPDDFTDQDISTALSAAPAAPSAAADVAKQIPSALVAGAENMVTWPAKLANLASPVGNWLGRKAEEYGIGQRDEQAGQNREKLRQLVDQQGGSKGIGQYLPEPQTPAGKFTRSGFELVPSMLAQPGNLAANAAVGLASGLAGEGAGQLAEKYAPGLEPAARVIAPILAGTAAASPLNAAVNKARSAIVPTAADHNAMSTFAFNQAKDLGVTLDPTAVSNEISNIRSALVKKFGTEDRVTNTAKLLASEQAARAPNVQEAPDAMATLTGVRPGAPAPKAPVTTDEIKSLREQLGAIMFGDNATESLAARIAQKKLDDFLSNVKPEHVLSGDAKEAANLFKIARDEWSAMKRSEILAGRVQLGELNAATAGSARNKDNAARQAVKTLIRPNMQGKTAAAKEGYNDKEIAQMNRVALGDTIENWVRKVGGGGLLQGGLGAGGAAMAYQTGDPTWLYPAAITAGAKGISNAMTKKQVRLLDEMVRSRVGSGYTVTQPPAPLVSGATGLLLGLQSGFDDH